MDKIVEVLMEQETLTSEQIQNIVEGKPFDTPVIEVQPV
jgi:ATP-dependent Zn protease